MPQRNAPLEVVAGIIGTAVRELVGHPDQQTTINQPIFVLIYYTANSTHFGLSSSRLPDRGRCNQLHSTCGIDTISACFSDNVGVVDNSSCPKKLAGFVLHAASTHNHRALEDLTRKLHEYCDVGQ